MKKISLILMILSILVPSFVSADYITNADQFSNVVVFVRFSDETSYEAPYDLAYYNDMFNALGSSSLKDYYLEVSYGQLQIDSYIPSYESEILYYTDSEPRGYYEPYDSSTNPLGYRNDSTSTSREHMLLKKAIEYADVQDWFSDDIDYDVNDDGILDSVTFMISGEDNGWSSLLWPHKWELYTVNASFKGLDVSEYTFELLGNDTSYDNQVDVAVLAHETFHLLGAPDLYHYYDYFGIEPIGYWGLMDYEDGPSHMLGYMKYEYGLWIDEVREITESGSYTLYPMQDSPDNLYRIKLPYDNEWLYLEYRDGDGLYESSLPQTGLLLYRVNNNVDGNEYGSYDDYGDPTDEIFVFRPYISDVNTPIVLDNSDGIDGNIDLAALSQNNTFDEANTSNDFLLFSAEGNILDVQITNVIEQDGYVTFDVAFPPRIELDIEMPSDYNTLKLIDAPYSSYSVVLSNLTSNQTVYYTVDGTMPNTTSTLYDGQIDIDADHNVVTIAVYDDQGQLLSSSSKTFEFSSIIETNHNGYGDMENILWVLHFEDTYNFTISFDSKTFTEIDYDYIYLDGDAYSGSELAGETFDYQTDLFILQFESDEYLEDFFGVLATVDVSNPLPYEMNGDYDVTLNIGDEYSELGLTFLIDNPHDFTYTVDGTVDTMVSGEYDIDYFIYDEGVLVGSTTRTIHIVDTVDPTISLIGDNQLTIEYGESFEDPGVITSDNSESVLTITTNGYVNSYYLGEYLLHYTVKDGSGNTATVTRTIHVVDTTAPLITLNPGIDTVDSIDDFIDANVTITDLVNDDLEATITSNLKNEPGTYEITYTVTDTSGNESTISRIVTILEEISYSVSCDEMLQTFSNDDDILIGDCYVGDEKMNLTTSLENLPIGISSLEYELSFNGMTFTHTIQVLITDSSVDITLWFKRRDNLV
jgi:M6 family metalloprotease-like protein